ncbi:MAG: sulfite exporter TauE/SafE family protein [Pseudomonadota bacterium]|nr:sulfite exporter TauE/SafE family protein [Pseudomonadota bacterium]
MRDFLISGLSDLSGIAIATMAAGLIVGAVARGYSGFGFSALLVSSWALVTDPARAVVVALVLEVLASVIQALSVWREVPWKRVGLLMAGALVGTPVGTYLLAHAPREPLKFGIAIFVLVAAALLLADVRLKLRVSRAGTAAVGVASGVANGSVAMGGLPVALLLTASGDSPATIRATVIAYFFLLDLVGLMFLARENLVTREALSLSLLSLPVMVAGVWLGGRRFLGATPDSFRRTTLVLLMVIAAIGVARALWMMM